MSRVLFAILAAGSAGCGSLIVTQRAAHELQEREGFTWHRHEAGGLVVHVERSPDSDAIARMVADTAAFARSQVLEYLGVPEFEPRISLFMVDTRQRMADLIGRETRGTAYHASRVVCVVLGEALLSRLAHEIFHVVAMNAWGVPPRWVNEGAAVDADAGIRGIDLHAVSRRLMERGELPSLDVIASRFDALPSARSYPAAGSVIRFVREAYGTDAVRALWQGGLPQLEAHTNTSAGLLEAGWLGVVERQPSGS